MSLRNARMPKLGDKIEARVEAEREKLEKKDAELKKIIKKSSKKN